jgi:hypothetical protein
MERSFYNDDFEELIKQKSDQYKIYPSIKFGKVLMVPFILHVNGTGLVSFYSSPASVILPLINYHHPYAR